MLNFLDMNTKYLHRHLHGIVMQGNKPGIAKGKKITVSLFNAANFYAYYNEYNYAGIQARIAGIKLSGYTVTTDLVKIKKQPADTELKVKTHFSLGKNPVWAVNNYSSVKFTFQFYEGTVNNKKKIIGIAYPTSKGVPLENVMAAEMDSRLILYLEAKIENNEYFLGDTSSVHYHLTKSGNFLNGIFINGNSNVAVLFKRLKSQFYKEKEMKDFFKDL